MVRVRPAAAVLLVVLVGASGGCSALDGSGALPGNDRSTTPVDTVTPVPVPDETAGASAETVTAVGFETPPGIDSSGAVDREQLRQAHRRHLVGQSYMLEITGEFPTSSGLETYAYRAQVANDSRYRLDFRSGEFVQMEYSNGSVRYVRDYDRTSDQWTVSTDAGIAAESPGYHADLMTTYLQGDADQIDRVTLNGTTYVRLFFTGIPPSDDSAFPERVTRYRATAFVTPDGFVRTVVLTLEYRVDGERRESSLRFEHTGLGTTTVDAPVWVQRSRGNATTTPAGTTVGDGSPTVQRAGNETVTDARNATTTDRPPTDNQT